MLIGRCAAWLERQAWAYTVAGFRGRFEVAPSFRFEPGSRVYGDGKAVLGAGSYVGRGTAIACGGGTTVRIGERTRVAAFVRINSTTRDPDDDEARIGGDVTIGDDVWVGHGVYIGPGITIGDGAVVGANSVVTRDVEPLEVVGGVPARHLRWKSDRAGPPPKGRP